MLRLLPNPKPFITAFACLLAWLLIGFSIGPARAGRPAEFRMALGPHMQILEDPDGSLTIDQVASNKFEDKFRPIHAKVLKLGLSDSVYWARFSLGPKLLPRTVAHSQLVLSVEKALLQSVRLFMALPVENFTRCREIRLFRGPLFMHPPVAGSSYRFLLPRDIPPGARFFLRFHGNGIALTIPVNLWTWVAMQVHQRDITLTLGLLYGTILAMCLYNFFILLTLRDKNYLYYILWMLGALGWLAAYNGHLMIYLPLTPWLGLKFYYASLGAAIFCVVLFTKSFLNTKEQIPILDKILSLFGVAALGIVFCGLAGFSQAASLASRAMALFGAPWVLVAAVISWRKGFKPARYLAWAWSISLVGIVSTSLVAGGYLPYTALSKNAWAIGTAIEAVFLAFALSDRIKGLQHEREILQKAGHELHRLSITDELTKLYNSRYFSRRLAELATGDWCPGGPLSCIMLDLDDFKQVNDTHGHPEGDKVLKGVGQIIKASIRESDLGCRYGGEEFAVLLPGSGKDAACRVAERIRRSFAAKLFPLDTGLRLSATISAGVAELKEGEDPSHMLRRADEALYLAKRNGKNRTELAMPPQTPSPQSGAGDNT